VSPVLQAGKGFPPTLLIHGEQDELVHVRQAYGMRDRLSELGAAVELKTFPGAKHSLIWDQEADVQSAVQEFLLSRLSPAPAC
jgi:dipeptidyl aminopeptidase/acylaminoacyl peptidase